MSDRSPSAPSTFAEAAKRVRHRLILRKSVLLLLKTWPYAASGLLLLIIVRWSGFGFATVGAGIFLLVLWLATCAVWAWRKAPGAYEACSFWDKAAGRSDDFANAWWFEDRGAKDEGQAWHLQRQAALLPAALTKLRQDVPLPDARWLSLLPIAVALMALVPRGSGSLLPDAALTDADKKAAVAEAKKLADKKLDADKLKGLTEDEKREIEKLQNKLQETAKSLEQDGAKTARQVLSELEKRARDAERMSSKLAAGDAAWASEQMIAEMRKHTDTAELGDAAAEKNTEATAKRAGELADKLKNPQLSPEVRDRMTETLHDISKQAQVEDKERTVAQHVLDAGRDMDQSLPKEAAQEFQKLADKMKLLAQREKAREELEKMAQQLRESAGNIAGQGSQGMQQLAGNQSEQGQQGQQGQGAQGQQQQQQMMSMPNAQQSQPMQMQGMAQGQLSQGQQGNSQQMQTFTPAPNDGKGQQMTVAPPDGKSDGKKDKSDKPMLIAPIPGMPQGDPDSVIIMPGASSGNQAGNGVAKMDDKATAPSKAGQQGVVNAARNADGASSVRAIEGQARNEQSARSARATTMETIMAEENALDDAALPPARREQVRRYFNELRKRFEKSN